MLYGLSLVPPRRVFWACVLCMGVVRPCLSAQPPCLDKICACQTLLCPTPAGGFLALPQVMHTAGQLCSSDSHETLSPTELFYARPSTSIPSLLHALGQASLHVSEQAGSGLVRPGGCALYLCFAWYMGGGFRGALASLEHGACMHLERPCHSTWSWNAEGQGR